jgi:hypothetical protein
MSVVAAAVLIGARVHAQAVRDAAGTLEGTVSTQHGTVRLPGALVIVRGAPDQALAEQVTDDQGRFRISGVPAAHYQVHASLEGFQPADAPVVVADGQVAEVALDLPIAALSETVEVVASPVVSTSGTLAAAETVTSKQAELLAPGDGVQSTLRLLASVIAQPEGASIDGGRPDQVGFQIQSGSYVDPATNLEHLSIPGDAIDSVSVLPNPYEVEFGRFSSGVIAIQTHRAADRWKTRVDDAEPAFRLKRFTVFDIKGIAAVKPEFETGGPLFGGRLFLEQTAQYHYETTDIPSRPETELRTTKWFSSFSRVDAKLSSRHSLLVTGGFVPGTTTQATLGTFTPPSATADITNHVDHVMVTERFLRNSSAFVESTLKFHTYRTGVEGQGTSAMELLPETTLGSFFNRQDRRSAAYQWIETASDSRHALGGDHLFKVGFDLLHSRYDGTSASAPVIIARSDGTVARRLDFGGPTVQAVGSTDVAAFAQDRFQPATRWYVEFGGRIDRDGIVGRSAVTPRVGAALVLNAAATAVLRGGYGLFYERTPSIAAAFDQFEAATDTRFAADGVTPLGRPVLYQHVTAGDLQTARSATWDLAYDYRMNPTWALHAGLLDRHGSHELIVNPVGPIATDAPAELLLTSSGQSNYRQAEVGVHLTRGSRLDLEVSYVRSSAREDLNGIVNFYDSVLAPVIGANAYAPAPADAPNRVLVHGTTMPTPRWMLLGTVEWRDGLPYSIVDDTLEFVGARNDRRFPTYVRLDGGFDRRISMGKLHPWLGLRVSNALNSFLPADVQANTGSPAFGTFYNSVYREYRIHIRFER